MRLLPASAIYRLPKTSTARPTADDFDAIDFDGVLRKAAERLRERAASADITAADRKIAQDALVELFLARERSGAR